MAKKVEGYIKLQIPAGKATPAPPVNHPCSNYRICGQKLQLRNKDSAGTGID